MRGHRVLDSEGSIQCTEWYGRPEGVDAINAELLHFQSESAADRAAARADAASATAAEEYVDTVPGAPPPVSRPTIGAKADVTVTDPNVPEPEAPAAEVVEPEDGPPPRSGAGSGKDAWLAYAEAHDIEVDVEASRDAIADQVEAELESRKALVDAT